MPDLLTAVTFAFPKTDDVFYQRFVKFLSPCLDELVRGNRSSQQQVFFRPSESEFLPKIGMTEAAVQTPTIEFHTQSGKVYSIALTNETGEQKTSYEQYQLISFPEFSRRIAGCELVTLDHVGFNLPWFATPLHPKIVELRQQLAEGCLYHVFPTGESWDFILPATTEELLSDTAIDYSRRRKPKFELVSFEKSSTPLVQFDVSVAATYQQLTTLFPEALAIPEVASVWVYLENPYGIDVCLVLNPPAEKDWSGMFEGWRLRGEASANNSKPATLPS